MINRKIPRHFFILIFMSNLLFLEPEVKFDSINYDITGYCYQHNYNVKNAEL